MTYLQVPPHLVTNILPSVLTFWNHPEMSLLPANFPVPPVHFHIPFSAPVACDPSTLYVSPSLSRRAQWLLERTLPSGVASVITAHSPVVRLKIGSSLITILSARQTVSVCPLPR